MIFSLVLFVYLCSIFRVNADHSVDYKTIEGTIFWEMLTETRNGYRLARRQDGCRNVFAVFDPDGSVRAVRCMQALSGGGWLLHSSLSSKFPADAVKLSNAFEKRCLEYVKQGKGELENPMSYSWRFDEITGMHVGVLDLDNDEVLVYQSGDCVLSKHRGRCISLYEDLDKKLGLSFDLSKDASFSPVSFDPFEPGRDLEKTEDKRFYESKKRNSNLFEDFSNGCTPDRRSSIVNANLTHSDSCLPALPLHKCRIGYNDLGFSVDSNEVDGTKQRLSAKIPIPTSKFSFVSQLEDSKSLGLKEFVSVGSEELLPKNKMKSPSDVLSLNGKNYIPVEARKIFVHSDKTLINARLADVSSNINESDNVPSNEKNNAGVSKAGIFMIQEPTRIVLGQWYYTMISLPERVVAPDRVEYTYVPYKK